MDDEVLKWSKRFLKNKKLYLFRITEQLWYDKVTKINYYMVIWRDYTKDKVKIGNFHDKMYVRYGPSTKAVLTGTNATGLWQSAPGVISEEELEEMIKIAKDESTLPEFKIETLKDLTW